MCSRSSLLPWVKPQTLSPTAYLKGLRADPNPSAYLQELQVSIPRLVREIFSRLSLDPKPQVRSLSPDSSLALSLEPNPKP